jgi:HSP20 family protein
LQDIIETKDAFLVAADAPGFTPADISVEMNEGMLTISGKRKEEKVDEQEGKVRRSTQQGRAVSAALALVQHVQCAAFFDTCRYTQSLAAVQQPASVASRVSEFCC